jgi:hypothetical protein
MCQTYCHADSGHPASASENYEQYQECTTEMHVIGLGCLTTTSRHMGHAEHSPS